MLYSRVDRFFNPNLVTGALDQDVVQHIKYFLGGFIVATMLRDKNMVT